MSGHSKSPSSALAPPATPDSDSHENNGAADTPDTGQGKKLHLRSRPQLKGIFHPSLMLENSGSVARDHLASERTFLAYIRTSLLLASTGVALVQLFAVASVNARSVSATLNRIHQFARPLGATFVIFGLVVLAIGTRRYFLVQKLLTEGKFPVTRFSLGAVSVVIAIIIIIVFGILISARN